MPFMKMRKPEEEAQVFRAGPAKFKMTVDLQLKRCQEGSGICRKAFGGGDGHLRVNSRSNLRTWA